MHDYPEDEPVEIAGFTLLARRLPHYTLLTFGCRDRTATALAGYSGDSRADASARRPRARRRPVRLRGDARARRAGREPRGHLSVDEAVHAFEASGARRLLLTHRPGELPVENGLELAYDGMVVEID